MVEVGGFEPPSLAEARSRPLHPLLVVVLLAVSLGGIARQSRLNATKKRSLVYQKSPTLLRWSC